MIAMATAPNMEGSVTISVIISQVVETLSEIATEIFSATPRTEIRVSRGTQVSGRLYFESIPTEQAMQVIGPSALIETISAMVVLFTITGLVVGIAWPGPLTGALFPLSLLAWYTLYRIINRE